jgi:YD repeat-containing protein
MVSSAPYSTTTCTCSTCSLPTGAVLTYDTERRLTSWQSAPSTPGATAGYAYDGEGHRVAQSVSAGGSTTTTYYVAGLEEQANVSGGSSTLTKYYSVPGVISAVNVGGTLSLLSGGTLRALCLSQRLEDGAAVWYTSSRAR